MRKLNPRTKHMAETAGDFLSAFVTAVVVFMAAILVTVKLLGWNLFSVSSDSMSPQYPIYTLVLVRQAEPEEIKAGDVITYVFNEKGVLVTHRVTKNHAENQTFITKGDANNCEDAPVRWENMVGKVVLGIPFLGGPLSFLTAEKHRSAVIAVCVGISAFSLAWDVLNEKSRKKSKKKRKRKEVRNTKAECGFYT